MTAPSYNELVWLSAGLFGLVVGLVWRLAIEAKKNYLLRSDNTWLCAALDAARVQAERDRFIADMMQDDKLD